MRLPGRLAAAIEVLGDMAARRRPAADALRDWGLGHRFAGAGDRAAIGNLVYDALRRRASHAHAMGTDDPRALVLSVAVRDWGEDPDALAASFAGDRFAPDAITLDEAARLAAPDPLAGAPEHVRADIPEWLAPAFAEAFGEDWIAEGRALAGRPPLDLRANALKADRARVLRSLKRFSPEPGALAPQAVRVEAGSRDARTPNVVADEGFQKGWFEIQDQGSQLVSILAGTEPGMQVLDFCAGAGGKTLAMAASMGNRGQIFAHDSDRARLAPIYDRLKRAGVRNAQARAPEPGALDDLLDRMDLVLVDAPCTGSGTWRRRPDAKWRLGPEQLAARQQEQRDILAAAARHVRVGGRLAYVTCSLLSAENENQVGSFLAQHPGFSALSTSELWHEHCPGSPAAPRFTAHGVLLTPVRTGTDGFYFAALERTG